MKDKGRDEMEKYMICESPHYKGWGMPKILDTASTMKEALRKARPLAIKKGMVDIFTEKDTVGCAIGISTRTAYYYNLTKGKDVIARILSDGSLSSKTTEAGREEVIHTLRHWM